METVQKAISLLTRHGNNPGGKSSQTKPQTKYQSYEKKGREGPARNQGDKPRYFKKGNTLYCHRPRPQGSGQRNDQRHETRGIYEPQRKELQGWSSNKGKPGQKFLHGIYCFGCKKEGHMANDCLDKTGGSHPKARPRLFTIEIQSDQDKVTIQEEVEQVKHDDEGPTVENPEEEIEGDENPIEQENDEEQILYVKDDCELDNDDEPVAYLGAMRKDEESSEDKHIVQCAMMHGEPDLPELEENPPQEDWNWSCQYGVLHTGDCKECSRRVQHIGQALHRTSPSLNRAMDLPKRYAEQEFQQGVNIGTRTHQEPTGSVDEHLHAASHMMAYHLRVIEGE